MSNAKRFKSLEEEFNLPALDGSEGEAETDTPTLKKYQKHLHKLRT